jgi:hypothetical protein
MKMYSSIRSSSIVTNVCLALFGLLVLLLYPLQAQFTLDREPMGPSTRKTGLVITEIFYNPRLLPGLATNQTVEFIELYNSKPWAEDIGGYTIRSIAESAADGTSVYTFATNTVLAPNAFLVVARVPDLVKGQYNISNVVGPWIGAETNRLSRERGVVQLLNRQGAVLLSIDYQDSPPWPEAADGTGHSLSLVRPSYGENDFRAWAESDSVGGSPGVAEPLTQEPLAPVVINEWQNHSDPEDWIELYNHSNTAVDLSGAWLSDDPLTNKFRIPNGTSIPARGFQSWSQSQLGFELFAGGETIFFWNASETRVMDVIDFRGQSNNITSGRFPDGGPFTYGLRNGTRGGPNSSPMRYPVVISEIMYNPISGSADDEYIEIYNRGNLPVNMSGWEFVVGINYAFPTNAMTQTFPPGAYWVLASNPSNLIAIYTNLNTNNVFGPYTGTLANGGERVVLAAADYDRVQGPIGEVLEKLPVPVSDLIYGDGGAWGQWSDGLGSSLELIDLEGDVKHPSNWADSNDTGESLWTSIEYNGPVGQILGTPYNDSLILFLEGLGECLVDEVEVRVDGGPNLVINGGFESGLSGWTLQGSHDFSTIENEGFVGGKSLHLRAGSRGDNQSNRILSSPFASPIPADAQNVSIRAKVRWHRGLPEILLRLHGTATEAYGRLSLPRRLGTPGMANSRNVGNAGPAIYNVKHSPILPSVGQPVVVTAMATDPQPITSLNVRYRVDPNTTYSSIAMRDDGQGGDAITGDGIFSATLPARAAGEMVAFYVEGRDSQNAVGTFPKQVFPEPGFDRCWPYDAPLRECLVRWGETQMPGDFATYHLWVSAVNSNRWQTRNPMDNTEVDGTFVYNNYRVIYNALPLFSGSPWHRTNSTTGPAGINRVDYEMNFPDDDPLLGSTDFVLANPGNPDILTISDQSALAEQTVYRIFEGMGLVYNHRRYIHFFVNGNQRSKAYERTGNFIFEDSQQPNGDMIGQWFPDDPGGQLFKLEDWFEFTPNGFDFNFYDDADLARRTVSIGGEPTLMPAAYRFMFRKRSVGVGNSANDYSGIFALINAASPPENPNSATLDPDLLASAVDWEAWMRHFAVQRAVGNWDSYGWERGKNDYIYSSTNGFVHMPWDIDYSLGLGRPANAPLFGASDPRIVAMFNTPAIARAYWRAFSDLVNGPFSNAYLDPFIEANKAALVANNIDIDLDAVTAIKTYIGERRAYIQSQLATVQAPFALTGSTTITTDENLIVLTGTAPVEVKYINLNGVRYPVTWLTATTFQLRVVLLPGENLLELQSVDRFNTPIDGLTELVTATYTGPAPNPIGSLVLSEVQYAPPVANAQFVEIQNRSAQNFDLAGWSLNGAGLTFPAGSIITNRQTVVVARNRTAFISAYGSLPVFGLFPNTLSAQQQTLALVMPVGDTSLLVSAVRYEGTAPWPIPTDGESLQLIDAAQDNSRVSNWAIDSNAKATPGAPSSVAATLPPYDRLWLNEVQLVSLVGPDDNAGEPEPWLELFNSGANAVSLDGYYLADNLTTNLMSWPFPSGIVLQPGEMRLLWLDGEPEESAGTNLHTSFRLGDFARLALVRTTGGGPQITDYIKLPRLGANITYGSYPDGQIPFRSKLYRSTALQTNAPSFPPLFVNEWMPRNSGTVRDPADNGADDWFEIYNGGTQAIDLGGFFLTDTAVVPTQYQVPNNGRYRIPAGGFLVVWADDSPNQNAANRPDLHVNFQLGGSAGEIGIFAPDGLTPIDLVSYGNQTNDVSEGRYSDGAEPRYFMPRSTPRSSNAHPTYNSPPVFPNLPNQIVAPGQTVTLVIRASDPDGVPPQILTYSFLSGPTNGTLLLNQGGQMRWIIPTNQPTGDYPIQLQVTDDGVPPRSDTAGFTFFVRTQTIVTPDVPPAFYAVFAPPGQVTFSIETTPGRAYRVLYADELGGGTWLQLGRDFVAANPYASLTDSLAQPQRYYQVVLLP